MAFHTRFTPCIHITGTITPLLLVKIVGYKDHHTYLHSWTHFCSTKSYYRKFHLGAVYDAHGASGSTRRDCHDGGVKVRQDHIEQSVWTLPSGSDSFHLGSETCDIETILRSNLDSLKLDWLSSSSNWFALFHFGLSVSWLHLLIFPPYRSSRTEVLLYSSFCGDIFLIQATCRLNLSPSRLQAKISKHLSIKLLNVVMGRPG